jgi:hypothetical protein
LVAVLGLFSLALAVVIVHVAYNGRSVNKGRNLVEEEEEEEEEEEDDNG